MALDPAGGDLIVRPLSDAKHDPEMFEPIA
jgi:hypothetical protein